MDEDEAEPAVVPSDGIWNPQTTPPLAAKTEEKVRGNVFKVSRCMGGACLRNIPTYNTTGPEIITCHGLREIG